MRPDGLAWTRLKFKKNCACTLMLSCRTGNTTVKKSVLEWVSEMSRWQIRESLQVHVTRPLSPFFGWDLGTRLASGKIVWERDYSQTKTGSYVDVWALCRRLNSTSTSDFMSLSEFYVVVWVLCQRLSLSFMLTSEPYVVVWALCQCLCFQTSTSESLTLTFEWC